MVSRRQFLSSSLAGCFLLKVGKPAQASTSVAPLAEISAASRATFPQGVASADPQPDRLMLWTRVDPRRADGPNAVVTVLVSTDPTFETVVVERTLVVNKAQDYTLRTIITGLPPKTDYYYRFISSEGVSSRTGRTWTAPPDIEQRETTVAFVSCQGFPPSRYGSYRHLIESEKSGAAERPDLVLHLGDYIYGIQNPKGKSEEKEEPSREDELGNPLDTPFDLALEGQRRLYRRFLRDPDLQDARALYPFVCIWDDHEYANDPWQSYIAGEGSSPQKRLAASQAWFEFVPQILSQSRDISGAANEAYDYQVKVLEDVPMDHFGDGFISLEPNNLSAITALATYRAVRWGQLVDFLITDNRLYRGPGANPGYDEALIKTGKGNVRAFSGFTLHDGKLLDTLSRGREANNGNPPESVSISGKRVENPRRNSPPVSMLGLQQKSWFKRALKGSEATWKVWANAMPIMAFKFDPGSVSDEFQTGYLWTDGWDGFPNERQELMRYLLDQDIENVVSLSGDRHAHYAGLVAVDHEAELPRYVMPDFTCSAISAFARGPFLARHLRRLGLGHLAEATFVDSDGNQRTESTLNFFMRHGAKAAEVLASTGDPQQALDAADPSPNPHLHYADNSVNGYCVARFGKRAMECQFICIAPKPWDPETEPNGPSALRSVTFRVKRWKAGQTPGMQRLAVTGEPLFGDQS